MVRRGHQHVCVCGRNSSVPSLLPCRSGRRAWSQGVHSALAAAIMPMPEVEQVSLSLFLCFPPFP